MWPLEVQRMTEIFPRKFQWSLLNSQVQLTHLKGLLIDVEVLCNHGFYRVCCPQTGAFQTIFRIQTGVFTPCGTPAAFPDMTQMWV